MSCARAGNQPFVWPANLSSWPACGLSKGIAGTIQPRWHHISAHHEDRRQYRAAESLFRCYEANIIIEAIVRTEAGWSRFEAPSVLDHEVCVIS